VEVLKTYFNTNDEIVWQELALYKVTSEEITERVKVERLLREFGARAIAIRKDFIVFETTGHREETNKLMKDSISLSILGFSTVLSVAHLVLSFVVVPHIFGFLISSSTLIFNILAIIYILKVKGKMDEDYKV
jgi:hypothetical protein